MSATLKEYDVFISFRGEDTRANFTSHIYSALCKNKIKAYIDDQHLAKGEDVGPGLSKAIEDSHVAVVVFSKNYASSKWCLEELVKILQCRKEEGQVVIPVFFEVDPSDIRNQTGTYGEALAKHERELAQHKEEIRRKVSQWRAALTEAANISGRDIWSREYKNHAEVIEKIVKDVMNSMELRFPNETEVKNLVGFDKFCQDVELLMLKNRKNQLLENVQAIGIWGMGGIGKTTIAKGIFARHFPHYDGVCFFESVREASLSNSPRELTSLKEKLLSELLKDENAMSIISPFTARRLSTQKVFIVLDDVDSPEQLETLYQVCSHVGPGSKLIITTRDRQLLRKRVDDADIYEVKRWSEEESLELFSLSAFQKKYPDEGYEGLSKRAVQYAGGVPLALKVLGSNLGAKGSAEIWESELEKLENNYTYDRIKKVLQVSYDGLEDLEKIIFLDIAFFFKGEYRSFAERILNASGFSATSGLKVLEDKALITISDGKRIQMHDLIQDMGLAIVRRCIQYPGSRFRDVEEVSDVLEYRRRGRYKVEGIQLDLSQMEDLRLNADAFTMMINLRFLKLYIPQGKRSGKVVYPSIFNEFYGKLRYLEWNGYNLESLPATLNTKMLVEICMPHSHITELWQGVKDVVNLEGIDLSDCKQLKNLPNLSKATRLKWVNLSGCKSLDVVHPSVLSLNTLETLILDGCENLTSLRSERKLTSLKKISVNGCMNLRKFSVSSDSMTSLDLINAGIETLHSSVGHSSKLTWLNMEGLKLKNLPNKLSFLTKLSELRISNCKQLVIDEQRLESLFGGLGNLTLLHLKDIDNVFKIPENISVLSKLRELRLDGSKVMTFPESIKHLCGLEILSLENCKRLKHLPELPTHIKDLYVVNCTSLVTVSTLKSFATEMIGKEKYISFENCIKLDESSLNSIIEGGQLSAISAVFQNVLLRSNNVEGSIYNFMKFCFPGSSVPDNFTYKTTDTSFTINLPSRSNMLGLVLCAVLSPSDEIKHPGAKIFCQCYNEDGKKVGYATRWYHEPIKNLNSDNVYIWYDAFHFDAIVTHSEQKVTFEFYVTNNLGETHQLNLNVRTKECGVRLIDPLELPNLLREFDMDFKSKWNLGTKLASELGVELSLELKLELESQQRETLTFNDINHQERKNCLFGKMAPHISKDAFLSRASKKVGVVKASKPFPAVAANPVTSIPHEDVVGVTSQSYSQRSKKAKTSSRSSSKMVSAGASLLLPQAKINSVSRCIEVTYAMICEGRRMVDFLSKL